MEIAVTGAGASSEVEPRATPARRGGFVLPAMLSLTVLLALLLAGLLDAARSAHDGASDMVRRAAAFYLAEAGVARASVAIADAIAARRAAPASATYVIDGRDVAVAIVDLRASIDINGASVETLERLFVRLGAPSSAAKTLARDIERTRSRRPLSGLHDRALDAALAPALASCLERYISAHGGQMTDDGPRDAIPADFGAAFEIAATTPLMSGQGAEVRAIVRATGDPQHPFLTHAWRRRVRSDAMPAASCWGAAT